MEKEKTERLISDDFNLFSKVFNVDEYGFWENDNYVLIQNKSLEEIARENSIDSRLLKEKKIKLGKNII